MADIFMEFLLEDLQEMLSSTHDFILAEQLEIQSLYQDLRFIKHTIQLTADGEHKELQDLVAHFQQVASEALEMVDYSTLIAIAKKKQSRAWRSLLSSDSAHVVKDQVIRICDPYHSQLLLDFKRQIQFIKNALEGVHIDSNKLIGEELGSPAYAEIAEKSIQYDEEIVVGFDHEEISLKKRLVGEYKQQLQVISIVGMAGIGKTTLAKRLYADRFITHHFYVQGWTCASQGYLKKNLLRDILSGVVENEDETNSLSEVKLGEKLYKRLKENRYLIVVDDIWNIEAWEDLRKYLPNDNNGSRVLLTTRLDNVALQIGSPQAPPHYMSFLNQDDSWDLLKQKVFRNAHCCPQELVDFGSRIAAKCQGLPLALVVVGGLLSKTDRTKERWEEVSESMSAGNVGQRYMGILELSYNHLPHHLKLCFLYMGDFPENREIPVWRMILEWIAQGLVVGTPEKCSRATAEEYLVDLIGRSLLIVSKRSSRNRVKTCRMHNMLRDLCSIKAEERKIKSGKHIIDWYSPYGNNASTSSHILAEKLCFHSHGYHVVSGNPCFPHVYFTFPQTHHLQTSSYIYKLLKVLNLGCIALKTFPHEILELYHLRFLEICVRNLDSLPTLISNLWNLEVLIVNKGNLGIGTRMPQSFWNMVKLRHLRVSGVIKLEKPSANHGYPPVLGSLQSISALRLTLSQEDMMFFLTRILNLRKVKFYRRPNECERISFPNLANLIHLDTFKLIDTTWGAPYPVIPQPVSFPQSLKKITLSGGHADWKQISKLGKLPNLEVLKLGLDVFSGQTWETRDGEFLRLKYLKLSWMDLEQWITSSSHFPCLEQLVVEKCLALREIPSCLGDVATLQMIKISWSNQCASNSALKILEEQHNLGNDQLVVSVINPQGVHVTSSGS